jgi:hypothetical protein
MLPMFAELMEEHIIFSLPARTPAGYGRRYNPRTVSGYFTRDRGGSMGVVSGNRIENQEASFYVEDDTNGTGVIKQGDYLEVDSELYVFNHDDAFSREGGFIIYRLQLVPAFTGKQRSDSGVDLASDYA